MTLKQRTDEERAAPWALALAALLALLLAWRLVALRFNATDLFFDEAQYWYWSLSPDFGYYSKPPLIAWVIRLATDACGAASVFCIRLPAPLIHMLTAAVVFLIGLRLYGPRTGFFAGLVYATLPGVSFSSGIISTDVPLLLFWALALLGLVGLLERRDAWWPVLLIGVGLGLGLNAKYAMAYFLLSLAVYLIATPERRDLLKDGRLWAALAIGAALILPNLYWNWANSFATFSHTADNAKWGGRLLNPGKGAEFVIGQLGVFGPILFVALLTITWRAWKQGLPEADRLLLAFSLPIILLITVQAFVSRAHANWAATAYVAATVLVTATLLRDLSMRWLRGSLVLHLVLLVALGAAMATAGRFALPGVGEPFARTLGWAALGKEVEKRVAAGGGGGRRFAAVITDDRALTAELLYYARDLEKSGTRLLAWRPPGAKPNDHFELTRPYIAGTPDPVLLVSVRQDASDVLRHFAKAEPLGHEDLPAGQSKRRITFYALSGYRPDTAPAPKRR